MKKVATLGPSGTYSDIATKQYQKTCGESLEINHYPSIHSALNAVGDECDLAVLPIENFSEGFVALVLDHIMASELRVVDEIILPIHFACLGNTTDLSKIQKLFVQFVARGQCSEFITSLSKQLPDLEIITTETNMVSHQKLSFATQPAAAIIPAQVIAKLNINESAENAVTAVKAVNVVNAKNAEKAVAVTEPQLQIINNNVNDFQDNQTRFLVLSPKPIIQSEAPLNIPRSGSSLWKTSLVIIDDNDRPGLLAEILNSFAKRNVNLSSIVSRPTKVRFGTYNFLIDIEGHNAQSVVQEAIEEVSNLCEVKNLGSYAVARRAQN